MHFNYLTNLYGFQLIYVHKGGFQSAQVIPNLVLLHIDAYSRRGICQEIKNNVTIDT